MTDTDGGLATQVISERSVPLVAHLLLFGLLASLAWASVPHALLAWWGGAIVAISLLRLVLWERARRRRLAPPSIVRMARLTMFALGLSWGIGGAVVMSHLSLADAMIVVLGMTGLLAGGLATLVADPWVFPIYSVAMFTPPVVALAIVQQSGFRELGPALMIIFVAFSIRLHRRAYHALRDRLRIEGELRAREQALADSERYHRALIEQALDLTTLVDANGYVRYASPSYHSVLGHRPEEIIGRRVFDLVHPDDLAATLAVFTEGSGTPGATRAHEFRFRHRDGSWRVIAAVGRNLFDDPVINAAIINGRDVTEQKRTADHERTLLRELQQAVSEVKVLKGILPICASCKRIRDSTGKWEAVESYVRERTNAEFSHGLCPDCAARDWDTALNRA